MTKEDFDSYFNATQLGNENPSTPTTTDYWGNSYYVIPIGRPVLAQPPGTNAQHKLNGIAFPPLQSMEATQKKLYVEVRFHRGDKLTRVWRDDGNGQHTLLTAEPINEEGYEYDLYKRASSLYPNCPSEGYELLRFGRILSASATPPQVPPATWFKVKFDTEGTGYIDINDSSIQKLSDADFPSFTGWQKLSEGSGPFASDGLCDIDLLKKILADNNASHNPHESTNVSQELQYYLQMNSDVRSKLRSLVCEMASEWDNTNNEERYRNLKQAGEYYAGDDNGYEKFIKFTEKIQFWDKTGLPDTTIEKLWFFHPLKFIKHFRACGWLSEKEFSRVYPNNRYPANSSPSPHQIRERYRGALNRALRKYLFLTPVRQAHFFGQGAVESDWMLSMQERSMIGNIVGNGFHGATINQMSKKDESILGHWYGEFSSEDDPWFRLNKYNSTGGYISSSYDWRNGNCDYEDSQKFRGRGFKQLTGRSNYADYWVYRGWISALSFTKAWWTDPQFIAKNRNGMIKIPANIEYPQHASLPENCLDSGAWYLRGLRPRVVVEMDRDLPNRGETAEEISREREISRKVTAAINGGTIDWQRRLEYTRSAKEILG